MPFNKADFEQLNEAVRSGNIIAARRMLRDSDDPRAPSMLAKLNAKYPPEATHAPAAKPRPVKSAPMPAPVDELSEVKSLIAQKKYDEAEALLWDSDSPEAAGLLKKIAAVRSIQPTTKAASTPGSKIEAKKKPSQKSHMTRNLILAAVVSVLLVCGVGFYIDYQQTEAAVNEISMRFDIQDVCFEVYREDYRHINFDDFYEACKQEAEGMIVHYRATVERCYKEWPDETFKEIECLADGGAKFSGTWIMIADAKSQ